MEYQEIFYKEAFGSDMYIGLKILVASKNISVIKELDAVRCALHKADSLICAEIQAEELKYLPRYIKGQENNRKVLEVFPQPIYVEEIPNGYCSDWCCRHLPWFVVTTTRGRFKIGWRKRVINLDWKETNISNDANKIFPDENTTKGDGYIHAWSLDDCSRYVQTLVNL